MSEEINFDDVEFGEPIEEREPNYRDGYIRGIYRARNIIDSKEKEIERLNNIIDKKEQFLGDNIKRLEREVVKRDNIINKIDEYVIKLRYYADEEDEGYKISKDIHNILQELKGSDKE